MPISVIDPEENPLQIGVDGKNQPKVDYLIANEEGRSPN